MTFTQTQIQAGLAYWKAYMPAVNAQNNVARAMGVEPKNIVQGLKNMRAIYEGRLEDAIATLQAACNMDMELVRAVCTATA